MTHFYRLVALVTLLLPASLLAQEKITAQPVPVNSASSLSHIFKKYALFSINTANVAQYVKDAAAGGEIRLELDLPGYATFPITMREHDILSNDYKLVVGGPQGRQEFGKPACMTYAGELLGQAGSSVNLTITNELLYGMLNGADRSWFIEPLRYFDNKANDNIYVVYETSDVIPNTKVNCGVTEAMTRRITNNGNARVEGTATGTCKMTDVAIASDDSMLYRYGTPLNVQQHNIGVMNTMVGLYSNAQLTGQYLEFRIVGQYVSTAVANNALSPLYTGQDATILLPNFRTWGEVGGFGFAYDMGVYWTTKDITDNAGSTGVIGLAYVGGTCTSFRYQILEDLFFLSGAELGVLAAHETGHNFGATHDASGAPFIMAPSVSTVTSFSAASITSMDSYMASVSATCFSGCNASAPVARFSSSTSSICTGSSITFTNYSVGEVTGVSWTFQNGSPATSTSQSQNVTFATPGLKTVTLTVTSAAGTNSLTKYIVVGNAIANNTCRTTSGGNTEYGALQMFLLNDLKYMVSSVPIGDNNYENAACSYSTILEAGATYQATANIGLNFPNPPPGLVYGNKIQLFIDYNNDGDFADANEAAYSSASCTNGTHTFTFTTPATIPVMDAILRMRVVVFSCSLANTNGCTLPTRSRTMDFGVAFASASILPTLLTSFDGYYNGGKNELNWQTETEVNTNRYIIERSIDGSNYTEIGNVPAKGLTRSRYNNYTLTDALLNIQSAKRFFYRLKIVDADGSYKFSKLVITTRPDGDKVQVIVYPNPVLRNTNLQIMKANSDMSLIEVFNSMGQRLYAKRMTASLYNVSVDIPSNWSPGVYMVRVSDNKESWSRPVMIK
jgi:hypothetical protein